MTPLVSIVIPAYNARRWICDSLGSALAQTWDRTEIIVMDDGSTDGTYEVAQRFQSARVKVARQPNAGAATARNTALALAQGDYIQWLDADDAIAPDKIALQLRRAADPDVLLTSAWGRFYYRTETAKVTPDSLWCDSQPVDWFLCKFRNGHWMNPGAWLVSRKLTECAGPWDSRLSLSGDDDGEYLCRLVAASKGVHFSDSALAYYRMGTGGLSWRRSEHAMESFFLATRLSIEHLHRLEDSDRTRAAAIMFLQSRLKYFYPLAPRLVEDAKALAAALGGSLHRPQVGWRFELARHVLGWERAARAKNGLWIADVYTKKAVERGIAALYSLKGA